ncbi:hypothetical protein [Superficieibacter sp. 1612_C1]|uniref:hypothetical protein n=1 Tax=Superficieibacter sp. 1612_C1 TaxID=2780382 RepID=UPI0018835CEE|nr:hypothetical protein [Superficieibacter sp. 1612_C1]
MSSESENGLFYKAIYHNVCIVAASIIFFSFINAATVIVAAGVIIITGILLKAGLNVLDDKYGVASSLKLKIYEALEEEFKIREWHRQHLPHEMYLYYNTRN